MVGSDGGIVDAASPPQADGLESLSTYLKVLGNPKRLHLVQFLVTPRYIEEIASELKMARQTAREHVQHLLDIGVVDTMRGRRDHGPVTEYVVVPQRLFAIHEAFGRIGVPERDVDADAGTRALTQPLSTGGTPPGDQDVPRVTIVHGLRIGQTMLLSGDGPWLIGRDPAATVSLDYDPFVSTRHAEIRRAPGGGHEVADLYSSNGTHVEWAPLDRGGTAPLENGGVLRVGKTILLFRRPG